MIQPAAPSWERFLTVDEFEAGARAALAPMAWDYFRSGADGEGTLARNRQAFDEHELWPRILVDVSHRDTSLELLGCATRAPLLIAPTAYQRLAHPEGELAMARAAEASATILVVSTLATVALEQVAAAAGGPKWFQLYVNKDRGLTRRLVERAERAGYRALVLTVDAPVLGRRFADERNGFALPDGLRVENLVDEGAPTGADGSTLAAWFAARHDASLSWRDLEWLSSLTALPLVLKGILRPDDAARAVDHGAAGVIVSNHGARQLDGTPATLDALAGVCAAVDGRATVLLDGGVRSGTDVLKALALGARAVLVGRPALWGLAVAGERGVARLLELFGAELSRAMALAGCPDLGSIDASLVRRRAR